MDPILVFAVPVGMTLVLALGWLAWRRGRPAVEGSTEAASGAYREAVDYLLTGQGERAIGELTRVLEVHPETVETYLTLGNLFRATGDPNRAIRIHKSVLVRDKLDPGTRLQATLALAFDYRAAGDDARALEAFERVLDLDPDAAPAYRRLSELYEAAGRYADAYEALRRHGKLTKAPDNAGLARIKIAEGRKLAMDGKRGPARKALEKAVSLAPDAAASHDALAEHHEAGGNRKKAMASWMQAVEAEPEGANLAWDALGDDAFAGAPRAELRKALARAAEKFDRHAAVLKVLARLEALEDRTDAALSLLDEARERDPSRADVEAERAGVLLRAGRTDEAAEILRALARTL